MQSSKPTLLLVEDNDALREALASALAEEYEVVALASGYAAIARLRSPAIFDAVVTDLRLPGADGLSVLRAVRTRVEPVPVFIMTAYASVESAVQCMREGATDYLAKPFDPAELRRRVARALAGRVRSVDPSGLVALSESMQAVLAAVDRVAATSATVLVTGETGTGKELVAARLHERSRRREGPFVKVSCAALPETLLESELFGHERGAFTGADRMRVGRFEEASGGTLLLDEIGEISPATQVKLLRVLQDQEFHRVGGTRALRTDARIVAATNRDLDAARRAGRFREDLFYRLNVVGIQLPPLRERPEDAVAIAERLLAGHARASGRALVLSEDARKAIERAAWPGNVRQLENTIERAALVAVEEVTAELLALGETGEVGFRFTLPPGGVSLEVVEREVVLAALRRSGFVQKEAARLLHISRRKLNYMVGKLGLTHPSWRRNRASEVGD